MYLSRSKSGLNAMIKNFRREVYWEIYVLHISSKRKSKLTSDSGNM